MYFFKHLRSPGQISVSPVMDHRSDVHTSIPASVRIVSTAFRPKQRPAGSPVQCVPARTSPGSTRPGREADHSPPPHPVQRIRRVELSLHFPLPSWQGQFWSHHLNMSITVRRNSEFNSHSAPSVSASCSTSSITDRVVTCQVSGTCTPTVATFWRSGQRHVNHVATDTLHLQATHFSCLSPEGDNAIPSRGITWLVTFLQT
jgi:hypothetical protein